MTFVLNSSSSSRRKTSGGPPQTKSGKGTPEVVREEAGSVNEAYCRSHGFSTRMGQEEKCEIG